MFIERLTEIPLAGAKIVKRYEDAELVAVEHDNGYVGIYAEDGDMLVRISSGLSKSDTLSAVEIADKMMGV